MRKYINEILIQIIQQPHDQAGSAVCINGKFRPTTVGSRDFILISLFNI